MLQRMSTLIRGFGFASLPISRTNLPPASNSSSWVAAAPYAGPLVLPRDSTNTCFLELTAIPDTSPKYIPSGSLKKSGVESNAISGADCPNAAAAKKTVSTITSNALFMFTPFRVGMGRAG
jgi:hypothetical protein